MNKLNEKSVTNILRVIKSKNGAFITVECLIQIMKNIIVNPDEQKYRVIRTNNKIFYEKVYKVEAAIDFLIEVGFRKKVEKMEEILYLPQLNAIAECKFKDALITLEELLLSLPKPVNEKVGSISYSQLKQLKKEKDEYINLILKQAEEDRLDKINREKRKLGLL